MEQTARHHSTTVGVCVPRPGDLSTEKHVYYHPPAAGREGKKAGRKEESGLILSQEIPKLCQSCNIPLWNRIECNMFLFFHR